MKTNEIIHLNETNLRPVISKLEQLLADFQLYYTNLRGLHWNIRGHAFFTLHSKFEELYNDAAAKVDEIAERILQLGATPEHNFSKYLQMSTVKETPVIACGKEAVAHILETLSTLIAEEREINKIASETGDEVTASLMSDYLREQEKLVWMLTASLS